MERKRENRYKRERGRNIICIIWRREKTRPILIRDERDASASGERDREKVVSLSLFLFPRARYDDNNAGRPAAHRKNFKNGNG
jgi:hypothetical protein